LNQEAVVKTLYRDHDYQTYWGFRVLAIDGSKRLLPDSDDVREAFGSMAWTSGNASPQQEYPQTVNRAVSLNAIKYQALDLLFSNEPLDPLLDRLVSL